MDDDVRWVTIVARAWLDDGGVRIRLLRADAEGVGADVVITSIDEASATVAAWLHALVSGDTTGRRHDEGPGTDATDDAGDDDVGRRS